MKKTLIASLLAFISIAQAHDLWVDVPAQIPSDSILKANMGYGHYPYVEKIPEARLKIFAPMEVISQWLLLGNSNIQTNILVTKCRRLENGKFKRFT